MRQGSRKRNTFIPVVEKITVNGIRYTLKENREFVNRQFISVKCCEKCVAFADLSLCVKLPEACQSEGGYWIKD